jgi:crotonobetainyl-CoA:carnitine CoA-transferase CaiB-like acyl-CoA transferase
MSGLDPNKPLDGIVVADMSRILAGPLCTMVLADLGADVIKIERPEGGDDTRTWGPPFRDGDAAYFLSINRNKKSITLDLTGANDREVARRIIDRADVVVENFRSGVVDKFGLGYEDVKGSNPELIYCSMPAFSFDDQRQLPGYDLLMQSISGFMSITGETEGEPVKMGVALLDVVAGLYAAVSILAALRQRSIDGTGSYVEVGLFEASVASLVNQAANYLVGGVIPEAAGSTHPNIVPYQSFAASDGRFVLAAANDKLFRAAAVALDRPDLADDDRYTTNSRRVGNREELIDELQTMFEEHPVEYWVDLFVRAGVPAAPVRNIEEVFQSPEGASTIVEIEDAGRGQLRLVKSPIRFRTRSAETPDAPPRLGQHNDAILEWLDRTPAKASNQGDEGVQ